MKYKFNGAVGNLFLGWLGYGFLTVITLGLAAPFAVHALIKYVVNNIEQLK